MLAAPPTRLAAERIDGEAVGGKASELVEKRQKHLLEEIFTDSV